MLIDAYPKKTLYLNYKMTKIIFSQPYNNKILNSFHKIGQQHLER